jgi:hypothetical protein
MVVKGQYYVIFDESTGCSSVPPSVPAEELAYEKIRRIANDFLSMVREANGRFQRTPGCLLAIRPKSNIQ